MQQEVLLRILHPYFDSMRLSVLLALISCYTFQGFGQVDFTSSNLPIIILNSQGEPNDQSKIAASLSIIANSQGQRNELTDPPSEYQGLCGLKIRGESSATFPKKSYSIEMWSSLGQDIDTSFLGFPAEEDFILYGPYSDKSLMNNVLVMHLAREMGQYASKTEYVELVLNGSYEGLYVLMEKIKRDEGRVDISKLKAEDIEGDELTGGYIFRLDKGEHEDWTSQQHIFDRPGRFVEYQYYYPPPEDLQPEQRVYIQEYMDAFEEAAVAEDYHNSEGRHYTEYINLRSFVDNFILNELSKNVDAYRLSTYFHKDKESKGGRLNAGPVWDFNLAFGNADFCNVLSTSDWLYYDCVGNSPAWWDNFLQDETFRAALGCRYHTLRQGLLSNNSLSGQIDQWSRKILEAQLRNYERWDILGVYIWPNAGFYTWSDSHSILMSFYKDWIEERLAWLDENMPAESGDCARFDDPDFEVTGVSSTVDAQDNLVDLYPNPATTTLSIQSEENIEQLMIMDLTGRVVYQQTMNSSSISVPFHLDQGAYLVRIQLNNTTLIKKLQVIAP